MPILGPSNPAAHQADVPAAPVWDDPRSRRKIDRRPGRCGRPLVPRINCPIAERDLWNVRVFYLDFIALNAGRFYVPHSGIMEGGASLASIHKKRY
jgi:hypothetical protein